MSIEPPAEMSKVSDPAALVFPLTIFSAAVTAALFAYSWHERGVRPFVMGLLMSFVVTASGQTLRYHLRARSLKAGVAARAWMRLVVIALLWAGVAMTVATVWRGFN
jgi:hypothetical protein